jgi:circadian clock protein KaiC
MKKIKSGIPGLDEITKGGILENSAVLIVGPPGTGKSVFALQFALGGMDNKEPALYISSEESKESLYSYAESLGINLDSYKNLFFFYEPNLAKPELFSLKVPIDLIKKNKIKRVVLDSLTLFKLVYGKTEFEFRGGIMDFLTNIKSLGVTLLATSEKSLSDFDKIDYEPQDFLFEGLILVAKIRRGSSFERVITVAKLRGQDHLLEAFPFVIKEGGITIFTKQLPFSLMGNAKENF